MKLTQKFILSTAAVMGLACAVSAMAAEISKPYTFVNGEVASAPEVNSNFDTAYDKINQLDTDKASVAYVDQQVAAASGGGATTVVTLLGTTTCPANWNVLATGIAVGRTMPNGSTITRPDLSGESFQCLDETYSTRNNGAYQTRTLLSTLNGDDGTTAVVCVRCWR
jgi:hypothetical protein